MGLNYQTLYFKPTIVVDGSRNQDNAIKDLLCRTWRNDVSPYPTTPIVISNGYECRPDLVSLAVYGTDDYGDLICKYNGISPFELNAGMVIYAPDVSWIEKSIDTRELDSCRLADDKVTIEKEPSSNAKQKASARFSSDIAVGDSPQFIIDKTTGVIIY
jgi:hypothetical protein